MSKDINDIGISVEYLNKSTGEIEYISSTSTRSIQPLSLLRLSVFCPVGMREKKNVANRTMDASEELRNLEIVNKEGYNKVTISGPKLDMDTDFRVWVAIISALTQYPLVENQISMPFTDFARLCEFSTRQVNKNLKERIAKSLRKITSTSLSVYKDMGEEIISATTHLINFSKVDTAKNEVVLEYNPGLKDLYDIDLKRVLKLKVFPAIKRDEVAKAIYIFLEGLPNNQVQVVSFDRLMKRLNMRSEPRKQLMIVRRAMKLLEEVKYLTYTEGYKVRGGKRQVYFSINSRDPDLTETED
ncbi:MULTISPECIES: replication initiation protein [Xenorhabdus]|uniref:replication initiation protein n=1 Tax=Xenorhabdus TaxID=626 RepID=UPI0030CEDAD2